MKLLITTILLLLITLTKQQAIKEVYPHLGAMVNKSEAGEVEFKKQLVKCELLWKKADKIGYDKLSITEKKSYSNCPEGQDYWEIFGPGCSWYCGGGLEVASATSSLKPSKDISYTAKKVNDLNYKTAWIEGVPGYGIGESITYDFPPTNPRITKIIVVNGYVKSEKSWTENSRVKKLKIYIDNKPFAILNLADTRREQEFTFEPIGNGDRKDLKKLALKPRWTMKFEIMDVYKGKKYEDTAITEIYFDGIDVH